MVTICIYSRWIKWPFISGLDKTKGTLSASLIDVKNDASDEDGFKVKRSYPWIKWIRKILLVYYEPKESNEWGVISKENGERFY